MTSEERKLARIARSKLSKLNKSGKTFEDIFTYENLCKYGKKSCKGVRWKNSTIHYETYLMSVMANEYVSLHNGTYKSKGFSSFKIIEHGNEREINALKIADRSIQKCLVNELLLPIMNKVLVYDNAASIKHKGMDFLLNRLKKMLRHHTNLYGLEGGILKFDFKSYFASIPHEGIKKMFRQYVTNAKLLTFLDMIVDSYQQLLSSKSPDNHHGIGLGSEVAQTIALLYVNSIDHYVKDRLGIIGYGRYMDDIFVVSNSIDKLRMIKSKMSDMADGLGVSMNSKKSKVIPFKHHDFTFLKFRIKLTSKHKVLVRLSRRSIKSMLRRIRIFYRLLRMKSIKLKQVMMSYQSWKGHARRCQSYQTVRNIDKALNAMLSCYQPCS